MLEIHLFGQMNVQIDGRPVEVPSRPAQLLLAYLALHAGQAQPRAKLGGLLWPDSDEKNARSNLRHALWRLRGALGEEHFEVDKTAITFQPNGDWRLDVAELYEEPLASASAEALLDQISFYRGELLPGAYEDWVVRERERLEAVFGDRVDLLLDRLVHEQRWREARDWAERWIAQGHVPEAAFRTLMLAYAAEGEISGVAETYQRCVEVLSRELGVEPSEETSQLFKQLSEGADPIKLRAPAGEGLDAPALEMAVEAQPPAFLEAASQVAPEPMFVGREPELERLLEGLRRAMQGHGQVVFIAGEAGRGKTALAHEFARRAQLETTDLLVGVGNGNAYTGYGDPYLPFRDVLTMLTGDVEGRWAAGSITSEQARRLWEHLPQALSASLDHGSDLLNVFINGHGLAERSRRRGVSPDLVRRLEQHLEEAEARAGNVERGQLFEQYTTVLRTLSVRQPLLILLDDLQWADQASISLLFHLGRRIDSARILVLGTYRREELALGIAGERHPLEKVIAELQLKFGDIEIDLAELQEQRNRGFVDAFIDTEPNELDQAFRQALFERTQGHPLFTVELLRAMQERGDLVRDQTGKWIAARTLNWNLLPARVEAAVEERIARLEEDLRDLLAVASVEGEDFTAQVVARVKREQERKVLRDLSQELERRHRLVREQGERPGGRQLLSLYRFAHHLFQRYLYESLSTAERRLLHGEIAAVLEELYQGRAEDIAVHLARHYGEAGDIERAVENLLLAGLRARHVHAHVEALEHFNRALRLIDDESSSAIRVKTERAQTLLDLFKGQEAVVAFQELYSLAQQGGESPVELRALLGLARAHYIVALDAGDTAHATTSLEAYQRAHDLARDLDDKKNMVRALVSTIWISDFWPEKRPMARANAEEADKLSQAVKDEDLMLESRLALFHTGSLKDREREGEALLQLFEERQDLTRLNNLLFGLMGTHLVVGNFRRAIECAEMGISVAGRIGVPPVQYATYKSIALLRLGRFGAARRALEEEVADESHPFGRAFRDSGVGIYLLEVSSYEDAIKTLESVIQMGKKLGRQWLASMGEAYLARAIVESGSASAMGLADLLTNLEGDDYPPSLYACGEAARGRGDFEEAVRLARLMSMNAEEMGRRPEITWARLLEARSLLELQAPAEALEAAEAGAQLADELEHRLSLWRLQAASARALDALGRPKDAATAFQRAAETLLGLVETIDDPRHKRAFIDNPTVAAVLKAAGAGTRSVDR